MANAYAALAGKAGNVKYAMMSARCPTVAGMATASTVFVDVFPVTRVKIAKKVSLRVVFKYLHFECIFVVSKFRHISRNK